ncbi:MAG TPA: aromatic-ring-hydroxylating dioxygenase subunit beta [Caldimonas sp.]|jgi:3-phenylpropionate/cinnamic acid dioxygenase small subunit|nr:aromatic-ring-hydroxylating dioxygenase subunit beta [Caldimonas sp.]HEX2542225.1 aromatic-ring-hydroxylating dioxygenase subunit beta [Caldimonas sp.]
MSEPTESSLIAFVVREARLLDDKRYEEWNALWTDDGIYWVPLVPDQPDGIHHTSHLYEDKLLRTLRVERLKSPRAYSQQPPSRAHHLLQTPTVESSDPVTNRYVLRTAFHYTEAQGDEIEFFVGTVYHHLTVHEGELRMTLKRVNLLNSDAALPAVQLFI